MTESKPTPAESGKIRWPGNFRSAWLANRHGATMDYGATFNPLTHDDVRDREMT